MPARSPADRKRAAPQAPPRESRTAPGGGGGALDFRPWQVAAAFAVLHLLVTLAALNPVPHQGGDNAAYLALARSILERGEYRELWDPALRPHTQYPPGFPLILAAALALGVKPFAGFKVLVALFSGAAVALSYLWARRVSTAGVAAAVALLLAVGPGVVTQSQLELSDVPFWLFTFVALWAFAHVARSTPPGVEPGAVPATDLEESAHPLRWVALGAAGTLCAWMTRSAGLPLVLAVVGWLALGRRWRALGIFAAVFAPVAGLWAVRQAVAGGDSPYMAPFWLVDPYRPGLGTIGPMDMVARMAANAWKYLSRHLPSLTIGMEENTAAVLFAASLLVLALAGWMRRMRRPGVAELLLPPYVGLVLVWPDEWADDRFILPLLPLFLLYAAESVAWTLEALPRPRLAGALVAVAVACGCLPALSEKVRDARECRLEYRGGNLHACQPAVFAGVFALAEEVRGRLPAGSVVISRKPTLFWAFSGYPSRLYPFDADPEALFRTVRETGARYVALDRSNEGLRFLFPAATRRRDRFCVVQGVTNDYAALGFITQGVPPPPPGSPPNYLYFCDAVGQRHGVSGAPGG